MPHDPGMAASVPGAASALLALFAMVRVACIDVRHLEIDPDWTALAAWSALGALVAVEGVGACPDAVVAATLAGGAAWLAGRLHPGGLGQGDVALFAMAGVVAGPELLPPVLGLAVAFCLASCAAYGLARGKRPGRIFRHMVPAAPPVLAALGPFFAWRIASALWPVPEGWWTTAVPALAGAVALVAALLAGALPMAVRRRAAAASRGASWRCIHQGEET